jgi:hypothetical protein
MVGGGTRDARGWSALAHVYRPCIHLLGETWGWGREGGGKYGREGGWKGGGYAGGMKKQKLKGDMKSQAFRDE